MPRFVANSRDVALSRDWNWRKLPCNIKELWRFLREKTLGKTLLMGRKSFEGLPAPLPGAQNPLLFETVEALMCPLD
jgi:dihydrofolate reductase